MIESPRITQTAAQPAAVIPFDIPRGEMPKVMGPAIVEILTALAAQGLAPAGPMFAHHLRMSADRFEFEVGFPVNGTVSPADRVVPSVIPAARVAQTVYQGGYEGLASAWGEFEGWIAANGHTSAPDLWERYVAGPESSPDPATWRTEFNRPLVG